MTHNPHHRVIIVILSRHGHKCAAINPVALEEPKPAPELDPSRLAPEIVIIVDFILMNLWENLTKPQIRLERRYKSSNPGSAQWASAGGELVGVRMGMDGLRIEMG